jgi:hypothetical protein
LPCELTRGASGGEGTKQRLHKDTNTALNLENITSEHASIMGEPIMEKEEGPYYGGGGGGGALLWRRRRRRGPIMEEEEEEGAYYGGGGA